MSSNKRTALRTAADDNVKQSLEFRVINFQLLMLWGFTYLFDRTYDADLRRLANWVYWR